VARKLKTYVTSIGFFELAVAAPSMKAALEAWGTERNLFHQGFAKETDDAAIVAATMAQPGIVLKRSVGSRGAFREHAELPKSLPADKPSPVPKSRPKIRPKVAKRGPPAKILNLAEARAANRRPPPSRWNEPDVNRKIAKRKRLAHAGRPNLLRPQRR